MQQEMAVIPHAGAVSVPRCGAKTRKGTACTRAAGMGTPHYGQGKCRAHGGLSLVKHGRYSKITRPRIAELITQFQADPDPLNIVAEVILLRALAVDFIERYDVFTEALIAWHESFSVRIDSETGEEIPRAAKPVQVLDVADAYRIVAEVTKVVERIERIQGARAVSWPDFYRVLTELTRVVDTYADPVAATKIKEGWLRINLGSGAPK